MGFDAYGLIADWPAAVVACRQTGGMDFFWDAPENPHGDDLPFAVERPYWGGWDFMAAGDWYWRLRPHLPGPARDALDAYLVMLYPDVLDGDPRQPDDLAADAGLTASGAFYSMRPATARRVSALADAVPWPVVAAAAERVVIPQVGPRDIVDVDHFRNVVSAHDGWLAEATRTGRGLIALISF